MTARGRTGSSPQVSIPHIDAVASWPRQGGTPSGLRNSGWPGCGPHSRDDAIWVGCDNDSLGGSIEYVSEALVRRKMERRHEKSFMCHLCQSHLRTHLDPDGNIIRRHQVGHKRPSSSDTKNQDSLESSRESWTSHQ